MFINLRRKVFVLLLFAGVAGEAHAANVPILPLVDGLTFARIEAGGDLTLVAVTSDDGQSIRGIELSARFDSEQRSPLALIEEVGLAEIQTTVREAYASGDIAAFDRADLVLPLDFTRLSVSAAINYSSHAAEAGEDLPRPALVQKASNALPWNSELSTEGRALLDYEVELAAVFSAAVRNAADLERVLIGFVLANDVGDREMLVRGAWPDGINTPRGRAAAAAAKSGDDMLQVGPYLVVPDDWRAFVDRVELHLAVNGSLRQRDVPARMTESVDLLVGRALAGSEGSVENPAEALLPDSAFPPGMLLLTGTPGGTAYRAPSRPHELTPLSAEQVTNFVDRWADVEATSGRYLAAGDRVEASGTFLGTMTLILTE